MDATSDNPESGGDEQCQIETCFLREAGCGIRYVLALEDIDENEYQLYMSRDVAERTYEVLGKMLGYAAVPPANVPIQPQPIPNNPFSAMPYHPWNSFWRT